MAEIYPPSKQRPVWAIAGLPEGVDGPPCRFAGHQEALRRRHHVLFNGKVIGKSEQPLYDAARWLLANNAAGEDDTIALFATGRFLPGVVAARTAETPSGATAVTEELAPQ
jgi:hypothetical protein